MGYNSNSIFKIWKICLCRKFGKYHVCMALGGGSRTFTPINPPIHAWLRGGSTHNTQGLTYSLIHFLQIMHYLYGMSFLIFFTKFHTKKCFTLRKFPQGFDQDPEGDPPDPWSNNPTQITKTICLIRKKFQNVSVVIFMKYYIHWTIHQNKVHGSIILLRMTNIS